MSKIWNKCLYLINYIGGKIPKRFQRKIADFPGVLNIFIWLSRSGFIEVLTPEGHKLVINQLFHSNLTSSGNLDGYEPEIRQTIKKLSKPGMIAYDIGANIGVFSFLFSFIVKPNGAVYAFEPEENNYICLEKSLKLNNINNIHLDKRAISNHKGREKFDRRGGAFSGRLVGDEVKYSQTGNIEYVDTINIDTLVAEEDIPAPDILKIDVEGNELLVLEGMKNILERYSPVIICELHTHLGELSNDVIKLLNSFNFSIYDLDELLDKKEKKTESNELSRERYIVAMK